MPCCVWFWFKYSNFTHSFCLSKRPAAFDFDSNIKILIIRFAFQNALLRSILIQVFKFYSFVLPFKMPCCVWFWFKYSNFTHSFCLSKCPAAFDFDSSIQILLIRFAFQNALLRLILIQVFKFYSFVLPFKMPCCVWFWFKYSNFTHSFCLSKCPAAFDFDSSIQILIIRFAFQNALLRLILIQVFKF
jgi:ferredoxin